ncbi:MAG TPA: hypothetical protein VJA23_04545, partial [Candidatus Nanoarchaeia archaeon]|nr:hypothetical protein [Candidatus Nanoarchaeia archaeon]
LISSSEDTFSEIDQKMLAAVPLVDTPEKIRLHTGNLIHYGYDFRVDGAREIFENGFAKTRQVTDALRDNSDYNGERLVGGGRLTDPRTGGVGHVIGWYTTILPFNVVTGPAQLPDQTPKNIELYEGARQVYQNVFPQILKPAPTPEVLESILSELELAFNEESWLRLDLGPGRDIQLYGYDYRTGGLVRSLFEYHQSIVQKAKKNEKGIKLSQDFSLGKDPESNDADIMGFLLICKD